MYPAAFCVNHPNPAIERISREDSVPIARRITYVSSSIYVEKRAVQFLVHARSIPLHRNGDFATTVSSINPSTTYYMRLYQEQSRAKKQKKTLLDYIRRQKNTTFMETKDLGGDNPPA